MMTDSHRAALAAHEALNRMADDVIAGRIESAPQPHAERKPTVEELAAQELAARQIAQSYEPAAYAAPDPYAQPHYGEQQAYQQPYPNEQYAADPTATYPEHYADEQQAQADHYAPQAYTAEQQAAAAEAYAAQFAASIAQTAVESATQHYAAQQPVAEQHQQPAPQPEPMAAPVIAPAPEVAVAPPVAFVAPAAAVAAAAPVVSVVREKQGNSLLTYFAAVLSLIAVCLTAVQGYVLNRSVDVMEKNIARNEFVRTCRDLVGSYYEVKQKVSLMMPAADRGNIAGASRITEANRLEAQAAITKFGSLSNYLGSFQDVAARVRYTELTKTLNGIVDVARTTPLSDLDRVFAPADKLFTGMSDDCVNQSRAMRL